MGGSWFYRSFSGFTCKYTEITISSKGEINFGASTTSTNTLLPHVDAPEGLIGPYWTDLTNLPSSLGEIYYTTMGESGNSVFVVQWYRVPSKTLVDADLTFQARLYEADGHIEFAYGSMMPHSLHSTDRNLASGSNVTIGLQNYVRDMGLTCGYNNPGVIFSGSWFYFSP